MTGVSYQTAMAAAALTAAQRADRTHLSGCSACSMAAARRRPGERCAEGGRLRASLQACERELRAERQAGRAPNPDQEVLFGLAPGGGARR